MQEYAPHSASHRRAIAPPPALSPRSALCSLWRRGGPGWETHQSSSRPGTGSGGRRFNGRPAPRVSYAAMPASRVGVIV